VGVPVSSAALVLCFEYPWAPFSAPFGVGTPSARLSWAVRNETSNMSLWACGDCPAAAPERKSRYRHVHVQPCTAMEIPSTPYTTCIQTWQLHDLFLHTIIRGPVGVVLLSFRNSDPSRASSEGSARRADPALVLSAGPRTDYDAHRAILALPAFRAVTLWLPTP
jgi:hypothetical protein